GQRRVAPGAAEAVARDRRGPGQVPRLRRLRFGRGARRLRAVGLPAPPADGSLIRRRSPHYLAGPATPARISGSPNAPAIGGAPIGDHRRTAALLPGADLPPSGLLVTPGLRHPAAARHGGRRRYLPSGDDAARARAGPGVELRLRP